MGQVTEQVRRDIDNLIIAQPDLSINDLHIHLKQKYSLFQDAIPTAGIASDAPEDPKLAIIQPRYTELQLDILEDVYINDWTAFQCVTKKVHFVMGRHGRNMLDLKREFNTEKERRTALEKLSKMTKYTKAKNEIDKLALERPIDFYNKVTKAVDSCFTYGRAAIQIIFESVRLESGESIKGAVKALKLLNARRLGRIKIEKESGEIVGVEYLDIKKVKNGIEVELLDEEKFIPIDELIYFVNDQGNVSTNSQYTGISLLESIINVSQVKRIIMNQNIKEAAKSHYAGTLIARFPETTELNVIQGWIANAAKAAGRWFAHRLNVEIQHWKADTDLDKYKTLVELIDGAIIRAVGIPSSLVGYESVKYSNMEELLIAWRESDLLPIRAWLKDILQKSYLNPVFQLFVKRESDVTNVQKVAETPEKEQGETEEIKITDDEVKLTYEFQDTSFLTKLEIIAGLKLITETGIKLTPEMVLRVAGYDEWVEEIVQYHAEQEEKKEQERQENIERFQEQQETIRKSSGNNFGDSHTPHVSDPAKKITDKIRERTSVKTPNPAQAATAEDLTADLLAEEKLNILKLLREKIEGLK